MVKKVISFILTIVMVMSLCSPGFVTSYATQDTETGTETETQTETAELTETVTETGKTETETEQAETESQKIVDISEIKDQQKDTAKDTNTQDETDTEENKGTYSIRIIPPRGGTVYFYSDDEVDLQAATEGIDKDSIYTMQAKAGDKVTLQVDALEMYKADTIHIIDAQTEKTLQDGKVKDGLFTFEMPETDVRVMADFVADTSGKHVITEFLDDQDLFAQTADADELVNSMPAYLTARFDDDSAGMVPGSWEIVGNEQDGDDLILSMRFSLPEGYSLADGVELPTVKLTGVGFYAVDTTAATPTWDNAKGAYKLTGTGGQVNYGTLESNDPVTIKSEGDGNSKDSQKVYYGATAHFYTRKVITDNSKVVYCLYPEKNPPSMGGTKSKIYNLHPCIYNGGTNIGHYGKHWNLMRALFYSNDSWTSANGRFFTWKGKNGKTLADIMREYKNKYPSDIFFNFNDSEAKMAHWLVHMLATKAYQDATWTEGLSSAQISTINALWTALTSQFDTPANPELRIAVEGTTNIKSSAHFGVSASGNGQWVQKSPTYKVYGTNGNQVTLTMSGGVKLYKGSESYGYSGSVTLSSGDTFHLEGALTQSGSFSQWNISGKYKDRYEIHLAVIYDTGGTYQDLAYLTRTANYSPNAAIEVDWINPGSVTVKKNWNDNNNSSGIRPSSITVSLWYSTNSSNRRGTKWGDYTLNSSNGWTQTVSVPTTNENGNVLYWQFYEDNVPNGYSASTSQSGSTFTITNTPTYGHAYVQKISSDTWLTDNNSHYSLAGAKYTVYSDAALKNAVGVLTTNASGTTNTIDLNPGTYYVKETSASQGFTLDPKTYTVNVASGQTASVTSYEIALVSMTIHKTWNDDNNKFGTRPSSLTMELFSWSTDYSKQQVVKTITISEAGGWTGTVTGLPQQDGNGNALYYAFREKGVPSYYNYSGDAGGTTNSEKTGFDSYITNTLQKGYLKLSKMSHDTELTSNNGNYSLEGAIYTVYTDSNCTTKAKYFGELKTDANGAAGPVEILPGHYYVKETKAPKGYKLDEKIYTVDVADGQTVTVNSKEPPAISVSVTKQWNDDANKFNVRPNSITMELWSGSVNDIMKMDTKVKNVTLTAANNWTATVSDLPATDGNGNKLYYGFWETTDNTPKFYTPSYPAGQLNSSKSGYEIKVINELQTGYLKLQKTSLKPDLTNGNTNYSLKDAVYTVYTDKACSVKATYFGELRTDEKGATGTVELLPGTYYVKETTAPKGFKLSDEVFTVTVNDKATVNIDAVDTPIYSKLSLKKVSADEGRTNGLTDGNTCYSLEGAEYYVYTDAACKTRAKDSSGKDITLVTKADGTTNEAEVVAATYYVREIKASKGYYLDDCNTKTPHSVTLELGKNGSVTCTEKPMNDPFAVMLSKKSYKNGVEVTNNAPSLEGAIFEVDYYQNTDGKASGTPDKKWYFKTDKDGYFKASTEKYYQPTVTLDDGTVVTSDSLYRSESGNPTYPLGTYTLREVKAPTYYEIKGSATIQGTGTTVDDPGKPLILVIKINTDTGKPGIYDGDKLTSGQVSVTNEVGITYNEEVYEGSLKVVKYGDDNKPLADVKFKLVGDDGSVYTGTTDKNGVYTFKELMPQHYVLTETETPDGSTLLKDNVDVNIPYEVSDQKAKDTKMDTSKAVHDASKNMYYFYDVTYNIKNGQAFPVVYTGGDQTMLYIGMTAALAMIGLGGYMVIRRRRER